MERGKAKWEEDEGRRRGQVTRLYLAVRQIKNVFFEKEKLEKRTLMDFILMCTFCMLL